ncbi:MAG: hypothetical protein K1000chlam2_00586 [Chlamydiae bacterium]|nr:hypothetical protein [Chlamydiota bacterium]
MKFDPTFKERFGISTPIRYIHDVTIEPRWQKGFEKAWKKLMKETVPNTSASRRRVFDAFLKRIEKLGDDLPYTKRVSIRYISKKVGYGVFAKENIAPYSILNHYGAVLKPDKAIATENDSTFMLSDFESYSLDAQKAGNWCRFMNHNPEEDKKTNVIAWEHYSKWGPRIIFTACNRGIKKGAQLLYSYGDSYWEEDGFLKL